MLKMNVDERGSFTELLHTHNAGQVSINISKPGITKGQHWHNTKFEQFIVVKGHGLIQQRNLNNPEGKVLEWEVSGDKIEAVHMMPGYTHNIITLLDKEDLVTVMYSTRCLTLGGRTRFLNRFRAHTLLYDEPFYLRADEFRRVLLADVPAELQWAKDMFVLNCALGCRIGDLKKLSKALRRLLEFCGIDRPVCLYDPEVGDNVLYRPLYEVASSKLGVICVCRQD